MSDDGGSYGDGGGGGDGGYGGYAFAAKSGPSTRSSIHAAAHNVGSTHATYTGGQFYPHKKARFAIPVVGEISFKSLALGIVVGILFTYFIVNKHLK